MIENFGPPVIVVNVETDGKIYNYEIPQKVYTTPYLPISGSRGSYYRKQVITYIKRHYSFYIDKTGMIYQVTSKGEVRNQKIKFQKSPDSEYK